MKVYTYSYGVQSLDKASLGGTLGLGTGGLLSLLLPGEKSLGKTIVTSLGGAAVGAGSGALIGALQEHHRHKKLRKAGVYVNKDGITVLRDKDGNEYPVVFTSPNNQMSAGSYIQSNNISDISKSLRARHKLYKSRGIDLPRHISTNDIILVDPKQAKFDPDLLHAVAMHEAGHQYAAKKGIKHKTRQAEEQAADKFAIENKANPDAMLAFLESGARNALEHSKYFKKLHFKKLPPDVQDKLVRHLIKSYRGDLLYKKTRL